MPSSKRVTLEELTKRVEALEAERDILKTMYRCAQSMDYEQAQQWLDCFTEDAAIKARSRVAAGSHAHHGREELAKFFAEHARDMGTYPKHYVLDPHITVSGNEAKVEAYWAVVSVLGGSSSYAPSLLGYGRYRDSLVKGSDGVWRFKERATEIEASGYDQMLPPSRRPGR